MDGRETLRRYWEARRSRRVDEAARRMHGPEWARRTGGVDEIADMRDKLAHGTVRFSYWKHDENGGLVLRRANGTTSERLVPVARRRALDPEYDEKIASCERRSAYIIWYWDLDKNAARCFNTNRFEEIEEYRPDEGSRGRTFRVEYTAWHKDNYQDEIEAADEEEARRIFWQRREQDNDDFGDCEITRVVEER